MFLLPKSCTSIRSSNFELSFSSFLRNLKLRIPYTYVETEGQIFSHVLSLKNGTTFATITYDSFCILPSATIAGKLVRVTGRFKLSIPSLTDFVELTDNQRRSNSVTLNLREIFMKISKLGKKKRYLIGLNLIEASNWLTLNKKFSPINHAHVHSRIANRKNWRGFCRFGLESTSI